MGQGWECVGQRAEPLSVRQGGQGAHSESEPERTRASDAVICNFCLFVNLCGVKLAGYRFRARTRTLAKCSQRLGTILRFNDFISQALLDRPTRGLAHAELIVYSAIKGLANC